jgi:hypothetical protein
MPESWCGIFNRSPAWKRRNRGRLIDHVQLGVRDAFCQPSVLCGDTPATTLIEKLKEVSAGRGAYVIFVQGDTGIEDEPAIALYTQAGNAGKCLAL